MKRRWKDMDFKVGYPAAHQMARCYKGDVIAWSLLGVGGVSVLGVVVYTVFAMWFV